MFSAKRFAGQGGYRSPQVNGKICRRTSTPGASRTQGSDSMIHISLGQILVLSCAVCWALAVMLWHRSGETLPAFELNLFKNALGLVLVVPSLLVVNGLALPEYPLIDMIVALLSGFLGIAVADTWYLRALNVMGASRTGIVASLFSPFVIILSVLVLGESLSRWQLPGFVLVMSGILLVTWRQNSEEVSHESLRRGTLYAVASVFMMAVGIVMVKELLETRPFLWTVSIRLFGGVAGMLTYMVIRRRWSPVWARFRQPQPWLWIVSGSFLGSYLSMLLWLAGYRLIPASEASVLNQTSSAWIVLFDWLLLGERISGRRLLGLLLTFVGIMVILIV